jgi:hypothetical protein
VVGMANVDNVRPPGVSDVLQSVPTLFGAAVPVVDTTFLPRDWTGVITNPRQWLVGDTTPGTELPAIDRRYPVALIAAVIVGNGAVVRRDRGDAGHEAALLVSVCALVAYTFSTFTFATVIHCLVALHL